MKITNIIQQCIRATYPQIHFVRLNTLFAFVSSGCRDQRVSTTDLGRGLKNLSKTTTKHDIKEPIVLLAIIIVDWSPINGSEIFQLHRASIAIKGRSLVIYEKVFTESKLNTQTAHQYFLDKLESLLPKSCTPIILSDAIYRSPWFKSVEDKGWYWVGRVRGKAEYLGSIYYGKKALFECEAVIFKRSRKGRAVKKKRGGISQRTNDKIHQKDAISHGPIRIDIWGDVLLLS